MPPGKRAVRARPPKMTIADSTYSSYSSDEPRTTYLIDCHRCGQQYDSAHAAWCRCLVKERSFVCPHCGECFCRAVSDFKLKFWTSAPPFLWERKLKSARLQSEPFKNPALDEARRPLVMVVDDDREICAIAIRLINETRLGVIVATNGEEAIRLAREYKPDVVLTDALMPKIDGREVCRTIKSDETLAATKVVIMSSVYTSSRFRREALTQFKADDFLVKPVSPAALRDALERAVSDDVSRVEPLREEPPLVDRALTLISEPIPDPMLSVASDEIVEAPPTDPIVPVSADDDTVEKEVAPARIKVDDLIRLHHAGVDANLVRETHTCGYAFSIDELIELRRAGISAEFFRRMNAASDAPLSLDDLRMLAQSASLSDSEHAARLLILSFTPADVARLISSGVDSAMIEELHALGCTSFTVTEIVRLKSSGVTPLFVSNLRELGCIDFSAAELIVLAASGVRDDMLIALKSLGVQIGSTADLIRLQMSGIGDDVLREFAASFTH